MANEEVPIWMANHDRNTPPTSWQQAHTVPHMRLHEPTGPPPPPPPPPTPPIVTPTLQASKIDLAAQQWLWSISADIQQLRRHRQAFQDAVYRVHGAHVLERAMYGYETELVALLRSGNASPVQRLPDVTMYASPCNNGGRGAADEHWRNYGQHTFAGAIDNFLSVVVHSTGYATAPACLQDALCYHLLDCMVPALWEKQLRVSASCLLEGVQ